MSYKELRISVLIRDNYTCQECGSENNLEVHHINYRMNGHKYDKLITLCYHCHSLKHPINRKKYLTSIGYFKNKKKQKRNKVKAKIYENEAIVLSKGKNGECSIGYI